MTLKMPPHWLSQIYHLPQRFVPQAKVSTIMASVAVTANAVIGVAERAVDVFRKLRDSFKLSDETKRQSKEFQSENEKLIFKSFDQKYSCKSVKEIPEEKFKAFANSLKERLELSEKVYHSLLDGLYVGENEDKLSEFHFKDGKGDIHHGRLITLKRNGKMDVAYAVFTLSFELAEKAIHPSCGWWSYVMALSSTTTKNEIQSLSESQKNKFSHWCEVQLYNRVVVECPKDLDE